MKFNEKTHAFIAAKFYNYLKESFGDRGVKSFIHATQYYAEQRGRRMAQRAIRDGRELTYDTYQQYGEWVPTPEILNSNEAHLKEVKSTAPDYEVHIFRCPWHIRFMELDCHEAGRVYCDHLDNSISRGFNPYIDFQVRQTLFKNDHCTHYISDAGLESGTNKPKKQEYLQSFEYHCAHIYWSFNEITSAIFKEKGEQINAKILNDFAETYGQEMADRLASYKHTNFNVTNC